jgi:hypothetical protein
VVVVEVEEEEASSSERSTAMKKRSRGRTEGLRASTWFVGRLVG